jgi:hypothetical protein
MGTLYPGLTRLEQRGFIKGEWRVTEKKRRGRPADGHSGRRSMSCSGAAKSASGPLWGVPWMLVAGIFRSVFLPALSGVGLGGLTALLLYFYLSPLLFRSEGDRPVPGFFPPPRRSFS